MLQRVGEDAEGFAVILGNQLVLITASVVTEAASFVAALCRRAEQLADARLNAALGTKGK